MNGLFPILIEDVDGEMVLFSSFYANTTIYAEDKHNVTITVSMFERVPPNYYTMSNCQWWLRRPVNFLRTSYYFPKPTRFTTPAAIKPFNKIQTQVFQRPVHLNVFISVYRLGVGKWYVRNLHCWKQARLPPRALHRSCRSSKIISFSTLSSKSSIMNFDLQ